MNERCFALKDHPDFYVARNQCYALTYPAFKDMVKNKRCCTLKCPFYKPKRSDIRKVNGVFSREGKRRDVK